MRFEFRHIRGLLVLSLLVATMVSAFADADKVVCIVAKIKATNGYSLTLVPVGQLPESHKLSPFATILIDGSVAKATDLRPGMQANAILSGNEVTAVYARTINVEAWGKISAVSNTSISISASDSPVNTYALTPSTTVILFGKPATVADLKPGQLVDVACSDMDALTALNIDVVNPMGGMVHGKVTAVTSTSIALTAHTETADSSSTFTINATTVVTVDGKSASLSDIRTGQTVDVTAPDGNLATTVAITTESGHRHRERDDQGSSTLAPRF